LPVEGSHPRASDLSSPSGNPARAWTVNTAWFGRATSAASQCRSGGRISCNLLRRICLLLAQSRHHDPLNQCPLLGVKRTLDGMSGMSANDPKRTSGVPECRSANCPRTPFRRAQIPAVIPLSKSALF
jgi:hypothetical protein